MVACKKFRRSKSVSKRVTLTNEAGNEVVGGVCQSVDSSVVLEQMEGRLVQTLYVFK